VLERNRLSLKSLNLKERRKSARKDFRSTRMPPSLNATTQKESLGIAYNSSFEGRGVSWVDVMTRDVLLLILRSSAARIVFDSARLHECVSSHMYVKGQSLLLASC